MMRTQLHVFQSLGHEMANVQNGQLSHHILEFHGVEFVSCRVTHDFVDMLRMWATLAQVFAQVFPAHTT
jgi:uncharacterized membrane protein